MSCCEGTRSLHKRYKIALLTGGHHPPTDRRMVTTSTGSTAASPAPGDCSRVCGMELTMMRHSDSSDTDATTSVAAGGFSVSPTKSDPTPGWCSKRSKSNTTSSSTSSIDSPARSRRRTTTWQTWRRRRVGVRWFSPSGVALVGYAILLILMVLGDRTVAVLLDTAGGVGGASENKAPVQAFGDELGGVNLERSIAAVFSRVAYGSTTTTKRSIPDNVYVPSLTTVSTPLLTTFRYDNKNKDTLGGSGPGGGGGGGGPGSDKDAHYNQQQISANHRNYELDLERDHVLPTSAPNAEILKSNSNPTYPNPNRHHNHDRHRHSNSTPYPHGHNAKKGFPTNSMFAGDIPAYSPPSRTFFTPPLPRNYTNPFADKPTLRGTNSDSTIINTGTYANRRPLPPPSLMPGHERIPMRPPDLVPGAPGPAGGMPPNGGGNGALLPGKLPGGGGDPTGGMMPSVAGGPGGVSSSQSQMEAQRKKALNTPSEKSSKLDAAKSGYDGNNKLYLLDENANSSAILPNGMHFPSISRILSGSNGRPQTIPDVLLRSVTLPPRPNNQPAGFDLGGGTTSLSNAKDRPGGSGPFGNRPVGLDGDRERDGGDVGGAGPEGAGGEGDGRRNHFGGGDDTGRDEDEDDDDEEEDEDDDPFEEGNGRHQPGGGGGGSTSNTGSATSTVSSMHVLSSSSSPITQRMPNLNLKSVMIKNGSGGSGEDTPGYGNDRNFQGEIADISTWTIAWNIHVYLSAILFTILAVYSIFKIIFYDKLTHLFSQSYFISIHLILIIICLLRIFYLCYDAYNIHFSFNLFTSELLLNLPLTFLTTTFAILILFLLLRSINHKTNRYSSILRPLTIMIGSGVHVGLCITLHLVESYETQQFYHKQHQLQLQNKQLLAASGLGARGTGSGAGGGHAPPTNIQIPPRVLSLICQIIYIFICLSLGILYLYMYRLLKRILNKSQNYIHGYNNLSYAIHITIATALLFILLAALQIYGAISISSQTRVKLSPSSGLPGEGPGGRPGGGGAGGGTLWASHIEIDWFQWGYQFSLRFIEIVIVALLSWVTGLKTGTSKVQREKDMEQPNASGFALFPCTSSSSQENFETDYPAVCNTNRNLHTYTMRTGKPIYDDNFALNSLNLDQGAQQDLQLGGPVPGGGVGPGSEFQRSLETNSMRSSSHNYSNNYNGSSNNEHGPDGGDDFLNETDPMPDHYENPNFELKQQQHGGGHHHHQQQHGVGGPSANQYHDIMDNCYSEPIGAPQYDTKSLRGHPMAGATAPHRNYDFQNFERPNFDPQHLPTLPQPSALGAAQSIARGEFRASKNLKTLKSGQLQNDLGGGGGGANTMGHHHHYNHHGGGMAPGPGDSFDRRIGVRKSGTLNNIGAMHFNQQHGSGRNHNSGSSASSSSSNNRSAGGPPQQQQQQQQRRGPPGGVQPQGGHHHPAAHGGFPHPGSFNDRLMNGQGAADSLERIPHGPDGGFDDAAAYYHSKKRSRESSSSSYTTGGGPVPYATSSDHHHHGHPHAHTHHGTESSSSPTASLGGSGNGTPTGPGAVPGVTGVLAGKMAPVGPDGSMLVAEQGFVRFRALEEPTLGSRTNLRDKPGGKQQQQQQQQQSQQPQQLFIGS